jgi:hypothetical protein
MNEYTCSHFVGERRQQQPKQPTTTNKQPTANSDRQHTNTPVQIMGRQDICIKKAGVCSTVLLLVLLAAVQWTAVAFLLPASSSNVVAKTTSLLFPQSSLVRLLEKPDWLEDAMEGFNPKQEDSKADRLSKILPMMESGLAGFAVDAELGFCAILVTDDQESFVPVVVSSIDTDRVTSPEALTMVQLAGGLDLGTTILPPDLLARVVADELGRDDEGDLRDLRRVISLTQMDALSNPAVATSSESYSESSTTLDPTIDKSSPERDSAIEGSLSKVWTAVRGLPGLATVQESQVKAALQKHADSNGKVDRDVFSNILDTIRKEVSPGEQSQVVFRLTANVLSGDAIKKVTIETTNAVHSLGLSLRNKVPVNVLVDDVSLLLPAGTIIERFPAFRPMSELLQDAKIMSGFIPTMFQKTQIDNDMKE